MTTRASVDLPPAEIPGYPDGRYSHQPGLLDQPLFILGHLYGCVHSEEAEEALFGADYEASAEFHRALREAAEWPTFALPLPGEHWLYVVYRTFEDDPGVDYLVYHQDWDSAETIASDEGHFRGPGLSWAELEAVALNGVPGGSTDDQHARLLLMLPALGDTRPADDAADTIARALSALTQVDDPGQAASIC